jgi:hypothetical protein
MQPFKLEHFAKDHPSEAFPVVEAVPGDTCRRIRREIATRLGLDPQIDPLAFTTAVRNESVLLPGVNATSSDFNVNALLGEWNLALSKDVYLNWDRFESLDRVLFVDVNNAFEYFWYPAAEDLEIIATDMSWILSVAHSGELYVLRVPEPQQR